MEKAANLHMQAQALISTYESACEALEKGQELTDDQIDAMLGTEADMGSMLDSLILMKKTEANRRMIAEKEEEKCMIFIKRIMKRLKTEERKGPDGKAVGKRTRRREYTDIEKLPKEYFAPQRGTINAAIQKEEKIPGTQVVEGYLAVTVR